MTKKRFITAHGHAVEMPVSPSSLDAIIKSPNLEWQGLPGAGLHALHETEPAIRRRRHGAGGVEMIAVADHSLDATSLRERLPRHCAIKASWLEWHLRLLAGNSEMTEDVSVIGGGPAGAACALWVHQLGMHALLLEARPVVGGLQLRSPYENRWIPGLQGKTGQEVAASLQAHLEAAAVPHELNFNVVSIQRSAERGARRLGSIEWPHNAAGALRRDRHWREASARWVRRV